jgi:hypothetical protein
MSAVGGVRWRLAFSGYALFLGIVSSAGLFACASSEDVKRLDQEISRVQSELEDANLEQARYAPGSLVHALVTLRLAALKHSLAMLEQKRASRVFYVSLSYSVDGRGVAPREGEVELARTIEKRLADARDRLRTAEARTRSSDRDSSALVEMETNALAIAQLEYQHDALRFGFPIYAAQVSGDAIAAPFTAAAIEGAAPQIDLVRERMKTALGVTLVEKSLVPKGTHSPEARDRETFVLRYHNGGATEIRAFQGVLRFADLEDREFFRLNVSSEAHIAPGASTTETRTLEIDPAAPQYDRLVSSPLEELKVRFEPRSITFADGTSLGDLGTPSTS